MKQAKYKLVYNDNSTHRILNLAKERKYEAAILEFNEYLQKFPYDISMHLCYINLLILVGQLEEAEDKLRNLPVIKKNFKKNADDYLLLQIRILSFSKRYEECYKLAMENISTLKRYGVGENGSFFLFLRKQLNLITEDDYTKPCYQSYLPRQILSYNETCAIEQIKSSKEPIEGNQTICFSEFFPLEFIYYHLRKGLPFENRRNSTFCHNHYIIKYDHSGYVNGSPINYLDVVTLNDTNDIITMYPYENKERQPYIDFNFLYEETDPKVKRLSQIDKFNQRYQK